MNKLRNKLKKLVVLILAIILLGTVPAQIEAYSHIPLKGLFNVLKEDDLGFAHALLHSGWIENMYQYGEGAPHKEIERRNRKKWECEKKNDEVANLVRKFWFRKSEDHQLLPTQFGYLSNIPNDQLGRLFGQIINCIYTLRQAQGERRKKIEAALIDAVITCGLQAEQYRDDLTASWWDVIDQGYNLKYDKKFASVREAEKKLQEKRSELKKKYKIIELEEELARASKNWGRKKGFSQIRREIEGRFKRKDYVKALKEAESEIFEHLDQEILCEYINTQEAETQMQKTIAKNVKQKREPIRKNVCEPIREALEFCKTKGIYTTRTVEGILWALFFHKLDDLISLEEKVKAINDCIDQIDNKFKNKEFCNGKRLDKFYKREDFDCFENETGTLRFDCFENETGTLREVDLQVKKVRENYDQSLHYFIYCGAGKFPPVVAQGSYGYQYEKDNEIYKISYSVPNCHETALLDLLSILWYNPTKNAFDDSVFPERVIKNGIGLKKLREVLKYFYLADKKEIKAQEYTYTYKGGKFTSLAKLKSLGKISTEEIEKLDITEVPVSYINRSEIKQEFMNIVSGIPEVMYCSSVKGRGKIFELETDVRNVVRILNYFYGTEVCFALPESNQEESCQKEKGIIELGDNQKGISTGSRVITFKAENENFTNNKIEIGINDHANYRYCTMVLTIESGHAFLTVPTRARSGSRVLHYDFTKKLVQNIIGVSQNQDIKACNIRDLVIFTLLSSESLLSGVNQGLNLPILNLIYYALALKTPEEKLAIIKDVLKRRPEYYDAIKNMIHNLVRTLPSDDQYLRGNLCEIIMGSEFGKKDLFLREYVKKVLKDPAFHNSDSGRAGTILKLALEKGDKEIISSIVDRPKFNAFGDGYGQALVVALSCCQTPPCELGENQDSREAEIAKKILESPKFDRWAEALKYALNPLRQASLKRLGTQQGERFDQIALEIVQHPKCNVDEYGMDDVIKLALAKKCFQIALCIINHPKFSPWLYILERLLKVAWDIRNEAVTLAIIQHDRFSVCDDVIKIFKEAIKEGREEIALAIVNHRTFIGRCTVIDTFTSVLQKGYEKIALAIVSHDKLYVGTYNIAAMLRYALKNKHPKVALSILYHPKFKVDYLGYEKFPVLAFQKISNQDSNESIQYDRYNEIALTLLGHPTFDYWLEAIEYALKKGSPEIALKIVRHPKFNASKSSKYKAIKVLEKALEYEYLDITLGIVSNYKFDPSEYGYKNILVDALILTKKDERWAAVAEKILCHPKFENWVLAAEHAIEKEYPKIALQIASHPRFNIGESKSRTMPLFAEALEKGYKNIILNLVNNVAFYEPVPSSSYPLDSACALDWAIQKGHTGIAFRIVNHEKFNTASDGCGVILVSALQDKTYKEIATKILKDPAFNDWIEATYRALLQDRHDIVSMIMDDPRFNLKGKGIGDLLKIAMEKKADNIVSLIAKDFPFELVKGYSVRILYLALEKGYRDIALIIGKDISFEMLFEKKIVGKILELALEQDIEDLVFKITEDPKFKSHHVYGASVVLALKNEKYKSVASKILDHPKFDSWNTTIKYALAKGDKKIAIQLIRDPRFKMSILFFPKNILIWVIKKGHLDIAEMLLEQKKFGESSDSSVKSILATLVAIKNWYIDIALKVIDLSAFGSSADLKCQSSSDYDDYIPQQIQNGYDDSDERNSLMARVFKFALEERYKKIALKFVNHSKFNVDKPWVQRVLVYVKELLKERPKDKLWLQEVIDVIEGKQKNKKE